ncbi:hypothetical protein SAMN04487898_103271 [Pedobacter sp. ok626]|uniref:hypothetical protein n=1 Tax=Pedobacter sp. ok626 TaxID=1761882 RepID=UPI000880E75B|nr:hypothetical protein [Pedobacter sp. ok626]SDJ56535.1 hypothetical protein SAMN04487898_103271 [Pedobacter sp. ok626]
MKKNNTTKAFLLSFAMVIAFSGCRTEEKDIPVNELAYKNIKIKNLFGVNAFEWDFLQDPNNPNDGSMVFEPKMNLLRSFSSVRHYMDWEKLEDKPNMYSFNPTTRGGWNYDAMYARAKTDGIFMLSCLKNTPDWLYNTYPKSMQGVDNVPVKYGANREDPASYIAQAKMIYQFVARYGANKNIDTTVIKLNTTPRWSGDKVNQVKVGLDLVNYVECNNEPDKWWQGKRAQQTGAEYAANLSAFYDGHKGKLGKYAGAKTADPNIKVVIGGLARPDVNFLKEIVEWCRTNRGVKADGSVDLCFDVVNYHLYSNDNTGWFGKFKSNKRGIAPELSNMGEIADSFVQYTTQLGKGIEVWTTETGYDLSDKSVQRAIPIGQKSALVTQADWILRTSLMYARHGLSRVFFYIAYDIDPPGTPSGSSPFGTSGLLNQGGRRPAADYLLQTTKLMGEYIYENTIKKDPFVDIYAFKDKKMYVLVVPDEKDRTEVYELDLGEKVKKARVYKLKPGADEMAHEDIATKGGKISVTVTETPTFIQAI